MKTVVVLMLCGVLIVCIVLLSMQFRAHEADKVEYASRLVSRAAQKKVFSAVARHVEENGKAPERLDILTQTGYLSARDILAPRVLHTRPEHPFNYRPENYGDPNALLLVDVRPWRSRFSSELHSARVVTSGTGETRIERDK